MRVNELKINNILIIPDKDNIDESMRLCATYHCGFEYNDFFLPAVLDDKAFLRDTIDFYKNLDGCPKFCTSHGAFFDITVFSEDAMIRKVSDYRVEQSLNIAEELGAKAVVFHTNYIPNFNLESYRAGFVARNFEYWSAKLDKHPDINIYMENMYDTDWTLLASLAKRFEPDARFGVCLDYAHAHVFGNAADIDGWVNGLAPYVRHLHINDNDFESDLHLALGEGNIDWNRFRDYYQTLFPNASVLIETGKPEKIRKSLEFISCL